MNESNRVISGSLFILASIAVAFILNFSQPIMVPFVLALLLRILIDPIIDFLNSEYVLSFSPSTVKILSPVLKPESNKTGLLIKYPSLIESVEIDEEP